MTDSGPALSFNEVTALAAKAARGAGLGWGHAEDLGRAARWLSEHGCPWDTALQTLLESDDAERLASCMVAAADWAAHAMPGERHGIEGGQERLWVLPLVSAALFGRRGSVSAGAPGLTVHLLPDGGIATEGDWPPARLAGPMVLEATRLPGPDLPLIARQARPGAGSAAALARLAALAHLTLVPATDASRSRGAGATQPDND